MTAKFTPVRQGWKEVFWKSFYSQVATYTNHFRAQKMPFRAQKCRTQKSNPVIPPQSYRYRRVPEMEQFCPPTSMQLPSTNKTSDDCNPPAMASLWGDPLLMRGVVWWLFCGTEWKGKKRNGTQLRSTLREGLSHAQKCKIGEDCAHAKYNSP